MDRLCFTTKKRHRSINVSSDYERSNVRNRFKYKLFVDDCILYNQRERTDDINTLQADLPKMNKMKLNPTNSKAIIFTKMRNFIP